MSGWLPKSSWQPAAPLTHHGRQDSLLLVRVERRSLRERFGVKDRCPLAAAAIVCHDIKVVGAGLDRHVRGL